MPSESASQHGLMAMATTEQGRARLRASGKKPPPASVAREFMQADKGRHFKSKHVRKKG